MSAHGMLISLDDGLRAYNLRQHSAGESTLVLVQEGSKSQFCGLLRLSFFIYKMDSLIHLWNSCLSLR